MRRLWALPLVPLYFAGLRVKNALVDVGVLKQKRLRWPVVSVGSLSAGGAGKTPVVLMLAELLQRHGIAVDVLSRGYGRGSGAVEEVDPEGTARRFGDEPVEMARAGVKVFVGAERFAAGRLAEGRVAEGVESTPQRRVHLLDDGFQHRKLARDLDVVLLTAEDVRDWLLPAGNLRETLRSLGRADVVVLREDEAEALLGLVARHSDAAIWVARRRLVVPVERPRMPLAFCAIARPAGLLTMLAEAGVAVAGVVRFPDHHAYEPEDFARLAEAAEHAGADGFVTTAKDATKIPAESLARLNEVGPVWVAKLQVELVDEAAALALLLQLIATA